MVLGNNTGLPISITVGAVFFAIQYARINSIRSAYTGEISNDIDFMIEVMISIS